MPVFSTQRGLQQSRGRAVVSRRTDHTQLSLVPFCKSGASSPRRARCVQADLCNRITASESSGFPGREPPALPEHQKAGASEGAQANGNPSQVRSASRRSEPTAQHAGVATARSDSHGPCASLQARTPTPKGPRQPCPRDPTSPSPQRSAHRAAQGKKMPLTFRWVAHVSHVG